MTNKRTYKFNESSLTLEFGNITSSTAQVLVSSDDYYLSMGGGVSESILKAGGTAIALDAAKKVPAALGDVIVTTAGTLSAQYIFHAITIGPHAATLTQNEIIKQITKRCLQMLDAFQLCSIAFPAIGAGAAGFTYEDVAVQMSEVITDDLLERKKPVDVTVYLYDRYRQMTEMDYIRFFEEVAARAPNLVRCSDSRTLEDTNSTITSKAISLPNEPVVTEGFTDTNNEIKMHRVHNLRKLLGALEDQRYKLEERMIDLLGNEEERETELTKLRQKLQENSDIRLGYLNELKILSDKDATPQQSMTPDKIIRTIFVSSTYKDLVAYRNAIKDQIVRRDMLFRGMEHFGADPTRIPPAEKIVEEVRKADVYLGIFGVRYGYVDQATGLSMTELEFNEAEASNKPMFIYVIRDDAPIKVSDIEPDPVGKTKLDVLKDRIKKKYVTYMFDSVEDLARQVYEDIGKL